MMCWTITVDAVRYEFYTRTFREALMQWLDLMDKLNGNRAWEPVPATRLVFQPTPLNDCPQLGG